MVEELTKEEKTAIANRYKPLLVLYPEIASNSHRKEHYHRGHRAGHPPIDQDYHPRDIGIVLDNASLPGFSRWFRKTTRSEILDAMSNNTIDHIDVVPKASPSEPDKFWNVYALIGNKDLWYPRRAYARIVPGSRRYAQYLVIQYWLPYFFDDWANVHEMDWEMASVVIKKRQIEERPVACAYRAHMGGSCAPWQEVEKADDAGEKSEVGTHPIVYVANGSHACYFHDDPVHPATAAVIGHELSRWLNRIPFMRKTFSDYVPSFDEGSKHFPEVELIPEPNAEGYWEGEWRWLNFRGRWGSKAKWPRQLAGLVWRFLRGKLWELPIEEGGPVGPNRQGLCWTDPFAWIEEECFTIEEPWLLGLT